MANNSDSDEYDSIVSTSYSTTSSSTDDTNFQNLSEEEIRRLLRLFRKELDRNPRIFFTPKIKRNVQSVINTDSIIENQYYKNVSVTIQEKESFKIPNDIPRLSNSFFGRQSELKDIDNLLNKNKLAVVTGLEGIGKTEFLKFYIENYYKKYQGNVEWLNGTTEDKFLDSIQYLSDKYRINNTVDDLTKYFSQINTFVVIDNAYQNIAFRKYFPRTKTDVLIATEYPDFVQKKLVLNLSPLRPEESLDLFQNNLTDEFERSDEKDWYILAKYFDNIPMALQFICVDFKQKMTNDKMTVNDYINVLKRKSKLMCDNPLSIEYEKVYFSFRLLMEQLIISEKENILILSILNICIYFNDDIINKQLLLNQKSIEISKDKLTEVLNILIKYKLITTIMKQNLQEIHIHNLIRRMLFNEQKKSKTVDLYFKMALGIPAALSALNIKFILNFAKELTDVFVEYFFEQNLDHLLEPIVKYGYKTILESILMLSSDPIELIRDYNLLEIAIESEQLKIVELLIKFNVENSANLLHLAAKKLSHAIIIILLKSGINVNAEDENKRTALHIIAEAEKEESALQCAKELVKNGANILAEDNFSLTALHYCLKNKLFKLALFLLTTKVVYNFHKQNPLKEVFDWELIKEKELRLVLNIIRELLLKGADKTVKDIEGRSLLHWAIETKSLEIVEFLIKDCAIDVNEQDIYGQTVLHRILDQTVTTKTESRFFVSTAKMLIANGAKTDIKDLEGNTAYDVGSHRGNVRLNLLIQFLNNEISEKKKQTHYLALEQPSKQKQKSKKSKKPKEKSTYPTYFSNTNPYRHQSFNTEKSTVVPTQNYINYASYAGMLSAQNSAPPVCLPGPSYKLLN